jgi:DNA-binding transcriptional LysR family regulator
MKALSKVYFKRLLRTCLVPLAQEGFDIAIRHASTIPETHVAWALCRTQAVLVASKDYLKARGTPTTLAELSEHDCLYYFRRGGPGTWTFEAARGAEKRQSVILQGPFATNNSEALREAALDGLGIAMLPDFSAQADLAAKRLVRVLPQFRTVGVFGDFLYAIRPYSPYLPRAARVFVYYLRKELKSGFA